jgi:hypothetical protein
MIYVPYEEDWKYKVSCKDKGQVLLLSNKNGVIICQEQMTEI